VRFERTPAFDADWARLSDDERAMFMQVVIDDFNPACDRRLRDPTAQWPRRLRVKAVRAATGLCELTWNFAGPDGRATFEWVADSTNPRIRWRRVGGHSIFRQP